MALKLPEKLISHLLQQTDQDSPLRSQLEQHAVLHGRMIVLSTLFNEEAIDLLYTLCQELDEKTLRLQLSALPRNKDFQVSHETIYRTLFIQYLCNR